MTVPQYFRFPNATANPTSLKDVLRALTVIQASVVETLPALAAFPTSSVFGQIVVINGGTANGNTYVSNGTTWQLLTSATLNSSSNITVGTLTAASLIVTTGIKGIANNTAAASGFVGEIITSTVASGGALGMTTGTAMNVTSITLTPGHWLVYGVVGFTPGAGCATTYLQGGNSTTSATLGPLGSGFSDPFALATVTVDAVETLPPTSFNVGTSGNMTVYLVAKAGFSIGTLSAYGMIEARRMW